MANVGVLSHLVSSPDVSFIYPLGEEHGFEAIERQVFQKVIGGMFLARDLNMRDVAIYVNGNSTRSEFLGTLAPRCARMGR